MTAVHLGGDLSSVLIQTGDGIPAIAHWGTALSDADLDNAAHPLDTDVTGGMLDENPAISLCPMVSDTFPGQVALDITDVNGAEIRAQFAAGYVEHSGSTATIQSVDAENGLTLRFVFEIEPKTGVVIARTELDSDTPIRVRYLSAPVFPAPQFGNEIIDFAGRWIGEFQRISTPWSAGVRLRDNRTGRTGHEHFPAAILPALGATNTQGEVWALHYGWSGGHRMVAEELPDGRRLIHFGHAANTELHASTRFASAPLYAVYSDQGFNGVAVAYQRFVRDEVMTWPDKNRPRPVHYNCWEAVYFNHNINELQDIASLAAALGAERFVLDDGWFGKRDDDTTSLGDWLIDPRKYPDGLSPLIDHVHSQGMTFGIWFEPEMINTDSDLCRAHPDWVLGPTDQTEGRQQRVLDMANAAVHDYLYDRISHILRSYDVDYIKWDHNRVLPYADADQARGTYVLIDRLRADFPEVEIESCASGGGRIDFGILSRTHRVWLSDSNDALERLRMQHEAALFLPWEVTGSHVGPRKCHTSGRVLDIRLRAWTAAQRHMGFEMDPRELTEDEAQVLCNVTTWWKTNRHWREGADILRLDMVDPVVTAELQRSQSGDDFVVFVAQTRSSGQILPRPIRLTGLDPDASYRIELINRDDCGPLSRGHTALKTGPITISGRALMSMGVNMPYMPPETIWVLQGAKL